jgi:hypothetical protein
LVLRPAFDFISFPISKAKKKHRHEISGHFTKDLGSWFQTLLSGFKYSVRLIFLRQASFWVSIIGGERLIVGELLSVAVFDLD